MQSIGIIFLAFFVLIATINASNCPPVTCMIACPNGFELNAQGCPICNCRRLGTSGTSTTAHSTTTKHVTTRPSTTRPTTTRSTTARPTTTRSTTARPTTTKHFTTRRS